MPHDSSVLVRHAQHRALRPVRADGHKITEISSATPSATLSSEAPTTTTNLVGYCHRADRCTALPWEAAQQHANSDTAGLRREATHAPICTWRKGPHAAAAVLTCVRCLCTGYPPRSPSVLARPTSPSGEADTSMRARTHAHIQQKQSMGSLTYLSLSIFPPCRQFAASVTAPRRGNHALATQPTERRERAGMGPGGGGRGGEGPHPTGHLRPLQHAHNRACAAYSTHRRTPFRARRKIACVYTQRQRQHVSHWTTITPPAPFCWHWMAAPLRGR